MCALLLLWAATILVGKIKGGQLVLTRRRWKYFTLIGVVVAVTIMLVVTFVLPGRPGGNAALPLFPTIVGLFVAQLYEPASSAQFKASDLSEKDAKTWKRISLGLVLVGIVVGSVAGIAGAAGNIGALALLLPIGMLFLVFAAAIWIMFRTRNRWLKPEP
ncbi:hypothetical protein AB4Z38_13710 [Arthrobacter sp. 2RAF6]|uniref:hypothetical protein n=1 Tax=Arthrobacter sp. 2RAF6 TaxID=3233002 RepID=UPI003F8F32A1